MLADRYSCRPIALGLPGRDAEIALFKRFIRDLARAGVGTMTYAWHTGGAYATGRTETRSCSTRLFRLTEAQALPDAYQRRYSHAELWDNYAAFIREILPVAEEHGVRLQLAPQRPAGRPPGRAAPVQQPRGVSPRHGDRRPQPLLRHPVLRRLLRRDVRPRRHGRGRGRGHLRIRQPRTHLPGPFPQHQLAHARFPRDVPGTTATSTCTAS